MTDTEGSSGSTLTTELASAEELNKRKIIAQSSFTRTFNSLCKLLDSGTPSGALNKTIEELEAKYKVLDERCEAISISIEPDPKVEDLLTDKYDMLNDIRSKVMRTKPKMSDCAYRDGHEKTEELIKSFKVSLTMPKPETKKFDGDPCTFAEYMSYVETYVAPNISDPKQCLALLVDTCTGKARDSIAYLLQCPNASEAYHAAKDILREMFGQKHQIVRAVMDECTYGPNIGPGDNLRSLVISMRKAMQGKWNDKLFELQEKDQKPSVSHMCKIVESYIQSRDNEYATANAVNHPANSQKDKKISKPVYSISTGSVKVECVLYKSDHYFNQCPKFLQLSLKSKYDLVSQKSLCRNCLHPGHIASKCKQKGMCRQCAGKHNVLHDHDFKTASQYIQNIGNVVSSSDTVLNVTKNDE